MCSMLKKNNWRYDANDNELKLMVKLRVVWLAIIALQDILSVYFATLYDERI